MSKYYVPWNISARGSYLIEANSPEEAEEIASNMAWDGDMDGMTKVIDADVFVPLVEES